jgi:general secretion pathway protein B
MSFILDALKKSELERQRQAVPGLMDVPKGQRRRGLPWWAYALAGLLLVNVGVLCVLLLRSPAAARAQGKPREAVSGEVARPAAPGDSTPAHFSPLDAPQYAPEIPVNTERAPPPAAPAEVAHASPRERPRTDPLLSEAQPQADNDELLPSINEVNLSGMAELHLDVHVYATRAAERFVYINMRKYREGMSLQEGPQLEKIRRDGAVLNYHGVRFLLPRQS